MPSASLMTSTSSLSRALRPQQERFKHFVNKHTTITDKKIKRRRYHADVKPQERIDTHDDKRAHARRKNIQNIQDKFMPDPQKTRSLRAPWARVWRAASVEFVGMAMFVFFATGGVVIANAFDPTAGVQSILLVAFTQAFALQTGIYYAANSSGGHLNPVVTLSFLLVGRMRFIVCILYWIAQLVGAIVGSAFLKAVIPDAFEGALGTTTLAAGYSHGRGILLESIMTFTLVSIIYATAIDKIGFGNNAPSAIGITVFLDIIIGWKFTGSSMNPFRTLGPAIVSNTWVNHYVYWVGPLIGSVIAACFYDFIPNSRPPNRYPHSAGTRMESGRPPVTLHVVKQKKSKGISSVASEEPEEFDKNEPETVLDVDSPTTRNPTS